jgi:hypothetical protein
MVSLMLRTFLDFSEEEVDLLIATIWRRYFMTSEQATTAKLLTMNSVNGWAMQFKNNLDFSLDMTPARTQSSKKMNWLSKNDRSQTWSRT